MAPLHCGALRWCAKRNSHSSCRILTSIDKLIVKFSHYILLYLFVPSSSSRYPKQSATVSLGSVLKWRAKLHRPYFSTLTVAHLLQQTAKCQTFWMSIVCWNTCFSRYRVVFRSSKTLHLVKKAPQLPTNDIKKVWHLASKFHSCNFCNRWATFSVENTALDTLSIELKRY
jgi:hypothetical protein